MRAKKLTKLRDRLNRTGHVAGVRQRNESRVGGDAGDQRLEINQSAAVRWHDRQPNPLGLSQMIQWPQDAVVIGCGHHNMIPGTNQAMDRRVERSGPARMKTDAVRVRRPNSLGNRPAERTYHQVGRRGRVVAATARRGATLTGKAAHRLQNRLGLGPTRRRVIQIDAILSVHVGFGAIDSRPRHAPGVIGGY